MYKCYYCELEISDPVDLPDGWIRVSTTTEEYKFCGWDCLLTFGSTNPILNKKLFRKIVAISE